MSVGTAAIAAAVTLNTKTLVFSGDVAWLRKLVSLTLSGHSGSPANYVVLVYRGSTLVALAQTPTGNVFSLDLNTTELVACFPSTVVFGEEREFDVFLYNADATSLELLGSGVMQIRQTKDYSGTVPVSPITDTTVSIGSFLFVNGKTYLHSSDDKYYEFAAYGAGAAVTEALDTHGYTLEELVP
jgi:hypothetical protein